MKEFARALPAIPLSRLPLFRLLALLAILPLSLSRPAAAQEVEDTVAVEGLIVTATPVPLPEGALGRHISVLQGEKLRAMGITRVTDALRTQAGMTLARNGSYGAATSLFIRGGESDYVQVMIDGISINQPGGSINLAGLTTESVERIEIVRGPASALYGSDAVAGVVNIITRAGTDGEGPVGTLTVRGGTYDRLDGSAEVRGGGESASYGVSLAHYATDGILDFNNRHENAVLNGTAEFRLDERSRARLTARLTDRTYNFPTDFTGAAVDINQATFSEANTVGVEVGRRLGDVDGGPGAVDLRALVSLHDEETGFDDPPDSPADTLGFFGFQSLNDIRRSSADLRASWVATENATLTLGGEFEHQRLRSFTQSFSQFGDSDDRSEHSRTNKAGYLHGIFGMGALHANAGVRLEDNQQYGEFVTWDVGASLEVAPTTRLRASAGRGIKEPTFFEAFATGFATGNPDLDPEQSTSWEVGIEQRVAGVARLSATWFDQSFDDLIQFTFSPPSPGDPNFFNVAEADARGLEVVGEATLRGLTLSAGWTWLDTEVVDSGFDEGEGATFVEGESLLRRPDNQLSFALSGPAGERVRWNASVRHVGERDDRDFAAFPTRPVTLDSYTVLDAAVEVELMEASGRVPGVDVFVKGENLGDEEYQEVFGFRAPGRAVFVGARIRVGGGR